MKHVIGLLTIFFCVNLAHAQSDGSTRTDWPHYGGTQLSWRYSALDEINDSNVKNNHGVSARHWSYSLYQSLRDD